MWPFRKTPLPLGQRGEDLAAKHLQRAGYRILDRNVRLGRNEIDIIAQEGDTVAFVEVKTRQTDSFAEPEANVNFGKRNRIRRAARVFIARQKDPDLYYRFDIVSVVLPDQGKPQVTLYRDAFRDKEPGR
ncbi:MAG: YraN family protein [Candidatus Hydrogenedentes bacterium]|nr:YraN family protein [Candidatus Hydrogenedentota bacterium]